VLVFEEFLKAEKTARYTREFKAQMVALMRSGRTAASMAKEIGPSALWVKQAARDAKSGDGGLSSRDTSLGRKTRDQLKVGAACSTRRLASSPSVSMAARKLGFRIVDPKNVHRRA